MNWLAWVGISLAALSLLLAAGFAHAAWYAARHTSLADYRAEIARRRTR